MSVPEPSRPPRGCRQCGTELVPSLLACPGCGALVHADELRRLADAAGRAEPAEALRLWREAMALLPPDSGQARSIAGRIDALSRQADAGAASSGGPTATAAGGGRRGWKRLAAGGGVLALLLAKSKTLLLLLLGQGKLLLVGLTKMGTLLSMLASFGVYWRLYGWEFAAGLLLSVYVHEMGHVFMLRRLGLGAGAPMFIPGLGALIRLRQQYMTPREDARIGLAGPLWGLGAAVAAAVAGLLLHSDALLVIAQWGAWLNLFNLVPLWSLDGARGFHALRRPARIVAAVVYAVAWLPAGPGIALLAAAGGVYGVLRRNEPPETDRRALVEYVALCAALAAFNWLPVRTPEPAAPAPQVAWHAVPLPPDAGPR